MQTPLTALSKTYPYTLWAKRLTISVWSAHSVILIILVIRAVNVLVFPRSHHSRTCVVKVVWRVLSFHEAFAGAQRTNGKCLNPHGADIN